MDSKWNVPVPAAAQDQRGTWTAEKGWKIYMQGATPRDEGLVVEADGRDNDGGTGGNAEKVDTNARADS
jgi:hypothetical protein